MFQHFCNNPCVIRSFPTCHFLKLFSDLLDLDFCDALRHLLRLQSMPTFHVPGLPALTLPASRLGVHVQYDLIEFETLRDSANMRREDWVAIAGEIASRYEDYDGFVVLQQLITPEFCEILNARLERVLRGEHDTGTPPDKAPTFKAEARAKAAAAGTEKAAAGEFTRHRDRHRGPHKSRHTDLRMDQHRRRPRFRPA